METKITENLMGNKAVADALQPPKHTPGPWTSDPEEDNDVTSGSLIIASVTGAPDGDPEALANARLIAAAPDLLGAAEAAVSAFTTRFGLTVQATDDAGFRLLTQRIAALKAAIAKATA